MTGRDLAMALAGAVVAGAAAGAAASLALAPKTEVASSPASAELAQKVERAELELTKTRAALEESKKSFAQLEERVTAAELKQSGSVAAAGDAPRVGTHTMGRSRRIVPTEHADGAPEEAQPVAVALDGAEFGGQIALELGKALDAAGGSELSFGGGLEELKAALDLRKLPEEERWQKAQEDLGITSAQAEELKRAIAERDKTLKEAATTETKTGPNGGTITIRRTDPAKTAHAQADYHDRVAQTLNEDQRKSWRSKGYEGAFGSGGPGGLGGPMVMTVEMATDKQVPAAKDPPK